MSKQLSSAMKDAMMLIFLHGREIIEIDTKKGSVWVLGNTEPYVTTPPAEAGGFLGRSPNPVAPGSKCILTKVMHNVNGQSSCRFMITLLNGQVIRTTIGTPTRKALQKRGMLMLEKHRRMRMLDGIGVLTKRGLYVLSQWPEYGELLALRTLEDL